MLIKRCLFLWLLFEIFYIILINFKKDGYIYIIIFVLIIKSFKIYLNQYISVYSWYNSV